MNIHDKGRELVEKEERNLNERFKEMEGVLQQDDRDLEKLDALIRQAEKDQQNIVPRSLES
jgi:hypothetical protein